MHLPLQSARLPVFFAALFLLLNTLAIPGLAQDRQTDLNRTQTERPPVKDTEARALLDRAQKELFVIDNERDQAALDRLERKTEAAGLAQVAEEQAKIQQALDGKQRGRQQLDTWGPPCYACIEGESGTFDDDTVWETKSNAHASGGSYIEVETNYPRLHYPPDHYSQEIQDRIIVSYDFSVDKHAYYIFWARFIAPSGHNNSVWVSIDDGSWHEWHLPVRTEWRWKFFHYFVPLEEGDHTLRIAFRESDTKIDRFIFSNTFQWPSGDGSDWCGPTDPCVDNEAPEVAINRTGSLFSLTVSDDKALEDLDINTTNLTQVSGSFSSGDASTTYLFVVTDPNEDASLDVTATDGCGETEYGSATYSPDGPCIIIDSDEDKPYTMWLRRLETSDTHARRFKIVSGAFEESGSAATFTGVVEDKHNPGDGFAFKVDFTGKTATPPPGSPKLPDYSVDTNDWIYYTGIEGTLHGFGRYEGAVLDVTRRGPALQIGDGANMNDAALFGGSGWFDFETIKQPTTGVHLLHDDKGDFNFQLDCGDDVCELDEGAPLVAIQPVVEDGVTTGFVVTVTEDTDLTDVAIATSNLTLDAGKSSSFDFSGTETLVSYTYTVDDPTAPASIQVDATDSCEKATSDAAFSAGSGEVCATVTEDCITVNLVDVVTNGDGTTTYNYRVVVDCDKGLSFIAFRLPDGVTATDFTTGFPVQNVENPGGNGGPSPSYRNIKFELGGDIKDGDSIQLSYTLPAGADYVDVSNQIDIRAKYSTTTTDLVIDATACQDECIFDDAAPTVVITPIVEDGVTTGFEVEVSDDTALETVDFDNLTNVTVDNADGFTPGAMMYTFILTVTDPSQDASFDVSATDACEKTTTKSGASTGDICVLDEAAPTIVITPVVEDGVTTGFEVEVSDDTALNEVTFSGLANVTVDNEGDFTMGDQTFTFVLTVTDPSQDASFDVETADACEKTTTDSGSSTGDICIADLGPPEVSYSVTEAGLITIVVTDDTGIATLSVETSIVPADPTPETTSDLVLVSNDFVEGDDPTTATVVYQITDFAANKFIRVRTTDLCGLTCPADFRPPGITFGPQSDPTFGPVTVIEPFVRPDAVAAGLSLQTVEPFRLLAKNSANPNPTVLENTFVPGTGQTSATVKIGNGLNQGSYTYAFLTADECNATVLDPPGTDDAAVQRQGLVAQLGAAAEVPEVFGLKGAYPNPFNPTTTLQVDVPEAAEVSLRVYDLLGREVATLLSGVVEAGVHRVTFEAGGLPSGTYLYRLVTPEGSFTKQMTLMK